MQPTKLAAPQQANEQKCGRKFLAGLKRQIPLIAVVMCMVIAYPLPGPGARAYAMAKYPIIISLFVLTGLVVRLSELAKGAAAVHVHVGIQFFSLLLIPLSYNFLVFHWGWTEKLGFLSHELAVGTMAAMLMPTTTTTNILWTQMAEGDATISAVNAVVGNMLGAFVAPLLATVLLSADAEDQHFGKTMWKMTWEIILPMVGGMLLQFIWQKVSPDSYPKAVPILKRCLELTMLVMTYGIFCGAFDEGMEGVTALNLLAMIFWITFLHLSYLGLAWALTFRLPLRQRIAFVITASQKTENMAFAILQIIFGDSSGIFTLPVVTYHSVQMIVAAGLVGPMREWVEALDAETTEKSAAASEPLAGQALP